MLPQQVLLLFDCDTAKQSANKGKLSQRAEQARVVDFDNPGNNDWLEVNQFTVSENRNTRRPDMVLFLNGLPLGVIELKNPADDFKRVVFV